MARRHFGVPADTACIWPTTNTIFDEMSQRLVCWAGEENIFVSTSITQHFHAKKVLCTTFGALKFTTLGADVCPLPDDLDVSAADQIDPVTCNPGSPGPVTSVNGQTGVVVLDAGDVGAADDALVVHLAGNENITGIKTFDNNVDINGTETLVGDLNLTGNVDITGNTSHNGTFTVIGDIDSSGTITHSGPFSTTSPLITLDGTVLATGPITLDGELTATDTIRVNPPDAATSCAVFTQANAVISTDANMMEVFYETFNTLRLNELGLLRVLTPPASTGLGKEGETTAQFHAGTSTSKAVRILDHTGVENAFIRGNGTATFLGAITAPNLLESAWTPVVVDSPQTASKYTSQVNGTAGFNSLQVRIIDGGKTAEYRGRLNSVTTGGVTDEIFATTPPTSIALGAGTASAVPLRNRGFMAQGSGGGIRITVSTTGAMQLLGSANTQPSINFDSCSYSLEL